MTDAYEGSIIRAMHRLEELMRQLIDAAKVRRERELHAPLHTSSYGISLAVPYSTSPTVGLEELRQQLINAAKVRRERKLVQPPVMQIPTHKHPSNRIHQCSQNQTQVVGNEQLQAKCERARVLLVRDVVFCPSLYT